MHMVGIHYKSIAANSENAPLVVKALPTRETSTSWPRTKQECPRLHCSDIAMRTVGSVVNTAKVTIQSLSDGLTQLCTLKVSTAG